MSGNEAFAYGAYLAGVKIGVGYPGTLSTEILENFQNIPMFTPNGRPMKKSLWM